MQCPFAFLDSGNSYPLHYERAEPVQIVAEAERQPDPHDASAGSMSLLKLFT